MISFLFVVFCLYCFSLIANKLGFQYSSFDQSKTQGLKGIMSVLIILYHLTNIAQVKFLSVFDSWGAPIVSVFFLISGYGLMLSYLKKRDSYLNGFLRKRLPNVLIPLITLSALYIFLLYLDTGLIPENIFSNLIDNGITILPFSWFSYCIIIFYLAFFLVFSLKALNINAKTTLMFVITFSLMIYTYMKGFGREWWVSSLAFPTGLVLGLFVEKKIHPYTKGKFWSIFFIPLCCLLLAGIVKSGNELLFAFAYIIIPLMIFHLMQFVKLKNKILEFLGKISYELYLIHGMWIFLLRGQAIYFNSEYLFALSVLILTIISATFFNRLFAKI